MPLDDPWLSQRMADYVHIRRAENDLHPAVTAAVEAFLAEAQRGILGALTAAARFQNGDDPDLNGFPDDSAWRRLVDRHIRPAVRRIFDAAYLRLAAARDTTGQAADAFTSGLADRLAAFPRNVFDRVRRAVAAARDRGETPTQLRDRVTDLMTLEEWDGQVMTMTRTETMTALNAGALAGAINEQQRTGDTWQKRWQATRDARVRHTHAEADGQIRDLFDPFTVGGHPLQFPGDPRGPAAEVINCRCSARYAPAGDASLTASAPWRTR